MLRIVRISPTKGCMKLQEQKTLSLYGRNDLFCFWFCLDAPTWIRSVAIKRFWGSWYHSLSQVRSGFQLGLGVSWPCFSSPNTKRIANINKPMLWLRPEAWGIRARCIWFIATTDHFLTENHSHWMVNLHWIPITKTRKWKGRFKLDTCIILLKLILKNW